MPGPLQHRQEVAIATGGIGAGRQGPARSSTAQIQAPHREARGLEAEAHSPQPLPLARSTQTVQQQHESPSGPTKRRIDHRQQGGITTDIYYNRFTPIQGQPGRPQGVPQGLEVGADPGPALTKGTQAATFFPTPVLRSSVSSPLSTALASPKTMAVWGNSNRAFLIPA